MKSYYRFEDKFGSYVVFKQLSQYVSSVNIDEVSMIDTGLTCNGCFDIGEEKVRRIVKESVDRIICVFDMDSGGRQDVIISEDFMKEEMISFESSLRKHGYSGRVEYIPTIYSTETIILYQFVDQLCGFAPEMIVGRHDVIGAIKYIVIMCAKLKRNNLVKNFTRFIEIEKLWENYNKVGLKNGLNATYFKVASNPVNIGLTMKEALHKRKLAEQLVVSLQEQETLLQFGSNKVTMLEQNVELNNISRRYLKDIGVLTKREG